LGGLTDPPRRFPTPGAPTRYRAATWPPWRNRRRCRMRPPGLLEAPHRRGERCRPVLGDRWKSGARSTLSSQCSPQMAPHGLLWPVVQHGLALTLSLAALLGPPIGFLLPSSLHHLPIATFETSSRLDLRQQLSQAVVASSWPPRIAHKRAATAVPAAAMPASPRRCRDQTTEV
jgi:hypothetical protein